jgi:AAA family ATP:ADP antiporter
MGAWDFSSTTEQQKYERLKLLYLTIAFFCVIGAYTVTKELKDTILLATLGGKQYIPWVKWAVMFALAPAILLYSKLVDSMRRYQLLVLYSIVFAVLNLVFAYFIGHPRIGIGNTDTHGYRWLGWLFYLFVESYSPFVVSVFWAFANSVNSPESAKNNYGFMTAGSKLGGIIAAGAAWSWFSYSTASDIFNHQLALVCSSVFLLGVPVVILLMMKHIPGRFLHGYEAAYQVEKKKRREGKEKTGVFAGLSMFLRYPYVLGIFGMVYFYEVVATVLGYLRVGIAQSNATTSSEVSSYLFASVFIMQLIGLFISLLGTSALLRFLGERLCLLLIPLVSGLLLAAFIFWPSPIMFVVAWIGLKALNYAFSWPVRESLYIPTVKEIKFKSKSWIDAFGSKFAKSSGSVFNVLTIGVSESMFLPVHSLFFAGVIGMWFVAASLLGKRFEQAVANNEVIGEEPEEPEESEA